MNAFPRKFLSLRDKHGAHHRSRSAPPGQKSRPLTSDTLRALFKNDHPKHGLAKEDTDKEKEYAKVGEIQHRLDELGITNVTVDHIRDIMYTKYAEGDPTKTVEFIDIEQKSSAGNIIPYNPLVSMVGAENRGNVTCYLDSLLFAMFAKMDAFECILKNTFPADDARSKLVNLVRIWVNMLRSGKLIRTDLMMLIQDSLAECGWTDAGQLEQQDTSEAFAFLTETLQLPLLSLQVDLFHQGRKEKDDHKVVYERLLNLAVPPDTGGKGIKLEDCLEEYFNARVDVLRDSEEAKKSGTEDKGDALPPLANRNTIRIVTEESRASTVMTSSPVSMTPTFPTASELKEGETITMQRIDPAEGPLPDSQPNDGESEFERRPATRHRSTSVIQNILIDDSNRRSNTDNSTLSRRNRRKGSTVVKAVTIPAWQFFRLIPWHAVTRNEPENDIEVAMNFDQRPVVGICLKRYTMTEAGQPTRHNTYIDIPDSLRLPHFMLADGSSDDEDDSRALDTDYKLVLQSVVCHRGDMLQSGHYIAFARVAPKLLTDNRRHEVDPPPDYEEAVWVRFDDLDIENRVTYVDDIKQTLRQEMPYLLFYQVVPMVDSPSTDDTEPEPPSYNDFRASIEQLASRVATPPEKSGHHGSYLGGRADTIGPVHSPPSKPPSIRFSGDFDRPRRSIDGIALGSHPGSIGSESRRQSIHWADSTAISPAATPDGNQSPLLSAADESTGSRLSRAAARFTARGRHSRSGSQTGENRISTTMSRVAGLMMRPSKEPLLDSSSLNKSSISSASRLSSDALRPDGDLLAASEELQLPEPLGFQRNAQKSGRSREKEKEKEKANKVKVSDQPERECTVM